MKYTTNSAVAICVGIAMVWLAGCAPEYSCHGNRDDQRIQCYESGCVGAGHEFKHDHDHPA